jgi:hypothetical protein
MRILAIPFPRFTAVDQDTRRSGQASHGEGERARESFTLTRWAAAVKFDLSDFANLREFMKNVAARPAVRTAM